MSDSYADKMKRQVENKTKTHPITAIENARRAENAVRNTYELIKKKPTVDELINILYRLYLQGTVDGRRELSEKEKTEWQQP